MNKEAVIQALEEEKHGLCNGTLCDSTSKEFVGCAVGALLFRAGWTQKRILGLEPDLEVWLEEDEIEKSEEEKAIESLIDIYDMTREEVFRIMQINDKESIETPLERQARVIAAIRDL